jgi:hypothetical protein
MTHSASRKQARRFFGAMGAAMRQTSRWLDTRSPLRTDTVIRRAGDLREIRFDARAWRGS